MNNDREKTIRETDHASSDGPLTEQDYDRKMACNCGWTGTFGDLLVGEKCPKCTGCHCDCKRLVE